MFRYYRLFTLNKRWRNLITYLKHSRIRFFAWRYRRITMKNHKIVRFNRFLKQNNNKNLIKLGTVVLGKSLLKKVNRKVILKLYKKRRWSNNFRLLIKPLKSVSNLNKPTLKKNTKKVNNQINVVKKTNKVKKFRSKFKPIHYFLRIFIKKIKKNNLKKYRRTVKSFFRVFKCSLKLLLLKGFLKLNKNKINNKPLKKKPSNYDVNVNSSSRFLQQVYK